jgi:predicted PurR-regulated permease PerM
MTLLMAVLVIYLYKPFLMTIIIAILLSIATYSATKRFVAITRSKVAGTLISTFLMSVIFFLPIIYSVNTLVQYINHFDVSYIEKISTYLTNLHYKLPDTLSSFQGYFDDFISKINVENITGFILPYATKFGKMSAGFLKDMFLIVIFFFFVNFYAEELVRYFKTVLPMQKEEVDEIFSQITDVMNIVFYSILTTAILEGLLFGIIGKIYGYDGLLLGILYGFSSLIPVIGGVIMWLPISLYELAAGNTKEALFFAAYSIIVISVIADTFLKPMIIKYINERFFKTKTMINELLVFLSILAGLSTFGFWGMVLGPAITTLFISILSVYKKIED